MRLKNCGIKPVHWKSMRNKPEIQKPRIKRGKSETDRSAGWESCKGNCRECRGRNGQNGHMPSWGVVTTITMTKDGLHLSYPAKVIRNQDACCTIKHVSLNTRDARPTMGHASSPTLPLEKRTVYRARWQTATKSSPPFQKKTLKSQSVIRQKNRPQQGLFGKPTEAQKCVKRKA